MGFLSATRVAAAMIPLLGGRLLPLPFICFLFPSLPLPQLLDRRFFRSARSGKKSMVLVKGDEKGSAEVRNLSGRSLPR
ncbi:hypothetical protein SEVIR_9G413250v4 [Setaria viridis]